MSSRKLYEKFHGRMVDTDVEVGFHDPKRLVYLGQAVAIEYQCDKENGGGDGQEAIYRHEFPSENVLATDETGRQLYILGPRLRVDEPGIID